MNHDRYILTPENYDGVTSALIGNGELCTTVGPTGYHTPPDQQTDIAHRTQHFVLAGRRHSGPLHSLVNQGSISRLLFIDGHRSEPKYWEQSIDPVTWRVDSRLYHGGPIAGSEPVYADEHTVCQVSLADNAFIAKTEVWNPDIAPHEVSFELRYDFRASDGWPSMLEVEDGVEIQFQSGNQPGSIRILSLIETEGVDRRLDRSGESVILRYEVLLENAAVFDLFTVIQFSDRTKYQFPVNLSDQSVGELMDRDSGACDRFWGSADVETGDLLTDAFRLIALYTLRCQATPWSVPPTVSEEYWGAGAFHDEMYPFLGLLSSNHVELAERIPYFRVTTLPQAMQRARGRGALYPWSSTEYGEERDPNGLWLTERFHLGQFAVCIWMLWLYNRDRIQLDDLYPVLREIARYFEMNMLERDEEGRLRTKACVDFDESVGPVTNGPFTICAAIASLEYAANAAEELGKDPERIPRWRELAAELRQNLPTAESAEGAEVFGIPGGKPLHYSILGPIFPFRVEENSERARASAEYIHRVCRSTKGWKPGFSEVFTGSNWMWTAGHLGIVHALQGNADLAWEAIKTAPESAGPFLSPNEHVDKDGVIHVPWFTTGCGGWLYALNCLFVQIDEEGTKLLPAVPSALPNARFRDLRADRGVLVSAEFQQGRLITLSAKAPKPMLWTFRIPAAFREDVDLRGSMTKSAPGWLTVTVELTGDSDSLIRVHNG